MVKFPEWLRDTARIVGMTQEHQQTCPRERCCPSFLDVDGEPVIVSCDDPGEPRTCCCGDEDCQGWP